MPSDGRKTWRVPVWNRTPDTFLNFIEVVSGAGMTPSERTAAARFVRKLWGVMIIQLYGAVSTSLPRTSLRESAQTSVTLLAVKARVYWHAVLASSDLRFNDAFTKVAVAAFGGLMYITNARDGYSVK